MKIINENSNLNAKESNLIQKKTDDTIKIVLIIVGIILIMYGFLYEIPSRIFSFDEIVKYVGGDAYNAIIESSIRGGEIAGAMITKTLCVCTGLIITALGCLKK